VEAGADPGARDPDGKTALDLVQERPSHAGCAGVAEWLVEQGTRGRGGPR
jgi:hypothetical protein